MLANFLLGPLRTRVMSALLLHPHATWGSRELAHHLGTPPTSTNRELLKLAEAGVLLRQRVGNRVHYRANDDNPVFEELAGLLRKTAGIATVLTEALQPLAKHIDCALVFGSIARGEESIYSDVDVLVLGSIGFTEVIEVLYPVQQYLKRDINPVVYRTDDFRTRLTTGNSFIHDVLEKPKLFLIGSADSMPNRPW